MPSLRKRWQLKEGDRRDRKRPNFVCSQQIGKEEWWQQIDGTAKRSQTAQSAFKQCVCVWGGVFGNRGS